MTRLAHTNRMPASVGGRYAKPARTADDYVRKMASVPKLASYEKRQHLANILRSGDYMERLGQGMIGPILLKLRYQGLTRSLLLEDPLVKGAELVYDVLDDTGKAYYLNANESEVKVRPFEGKRVNYNLFRIATFPSVKKEDLYGLRVDVVEYAQDESKQEIMKQEDRYCLTLLDTAIDDYAAAADHVITPSHEVSEASGYLTPGSFYDAVSAIEMHELEANRLIMNPQDYRDLYRWDIDQVGWKFKDDVVAGMKITYFGEFLLQKSILQTAGEVILAPDPKFLGMFPVMYSLDVEENNQVEQFKKGWVMDEVLSMLVLNARGLARIVKV